MYYQNVGGIRSKTSDLFLKSSGLDYDIIVICETWLNEHFNSNELFNCNYYNVFRKDRCSTKTGLNRGGGVLIATKKCFPVKTLDLKYQLLNADVDQLIIVIQFSINFELFIFASYIPPNSSYDIYDTHFRNCSYYLDDLKNFQHVIFVGDFNLGKITWNPKSYVPFISSSDIESLLLDFLSLCNLMQINTILNENSRLLDLVLVDNDLILDIFPPICPLFNKSFHHSPLVIEFSVINYQPLISNNNQFFDFKNADFVSLNTFLNSFDWNEVFVNVNLDNMYSKFLDILKVGMQTHIPVKSISMNNNPPWYNKRLANLKNKKNKAYKRYRNESSNLVLENDYVLCQKNFDSLNAFLYKSYISTTEISLKENSKHFWVFLNAKRKSNGLPSYMTYSGNGSSETQQICNYFADYFKSVYSANSYCDSLNYNIEPLLDLSSISLDIIDIENALCLLVDKSSIDNDGISNIVLKNCCAALSLPLLLIFNKSLSTSEFLDRWKISQVVPIHKSGSKLDVCNYRPISKILLIPKLFESIITSKITPLLHNTLSENQHGFRSGRSTVTNLSLFCNIIHKNFEKRLQTDVIFMDFAKAFDKVDHSILMLKLRLLGFGSVLLSWIISYLTNRYQFVKINNVFSNQFKVTSGVPQGSHLGPVLFLLFINDLPNSITHSACLLFADDLKIFRSIRNHNDCYLLQQDIVSVSNWCLSNNLDLNIKKCHSFSFYRGNLFLDFSYSINSVILDRVNTIKDLGLVLDNKLNFLSHIDYIASKAYSMLGFLKRNSTEFNDPFTLVSLYNCLVRPHLEYCCVIWNPTYHSHILRIEKIQKNFTRYCFIKLNWGFERPEYATRCALFGLSSLEVRRKMFSVIFIRDLIHNQIQCPDLLIKLNFYAPLRSLRGTFHFNNSSIRSNFGCNETIFHCTSLCNSIINLVDLFKQSSRQSFKHNLIMILNQVN